MRVGDAAGAESGPVADALEFLASLHPYCTGPDPYKKILFYLKRTQSRPMG
jgi:hypothetical protein